MVTRRKLLGALAVGGSVPLGAGAYCSTQGCTGVRNQLNNPASTTVTSRTLPPFGRRIAAGDSTVYLPTKLGVSAIEIETGRTAWKRALGPNVHDPFDALYTVGEYLVGVGIGSQGDSGWVAMRRDGNNSEYHIENWGQSNDLALPASTTDSIVVLPGETNLAAYDVPEGELVWQLEASRDDSEGIRRAALAAGAGRLYIATAHSNNEEWVLGVSDIRNPDDAEGISVSIDDSQVERVLGANFYNGAVYIHSSERLISFTPDGERKWTYVPDATIERKSDGSVGEFVGGNIVLNDGQKIVVLSGQDGSVLWERVFSESIRGFAATQRAVFVATYATELLDRATGTTALLGSFAHGSGEHLGDRALRKSPSTMEGSPNGAFLQSDANHLTIVSV